MKSDPHYERLRDPRDKEIERLRDALECVKRNTETRHIETLRAAKENMQSAWIAANAALVPPNIVLEQPDCRCSLSLVPRLNQGFGPVQMEVY